MNKILQRLQDVDPNDNEAVKEVINTIIQKEHLLKNPEINCNVALRFIEIVVTRFPRYCSQHRNTIENYLSHFLEAKNYYHVIVAAKCAHGLQQVRPSQDKMATPKNCWREQLSILCHAAHTLIEAIFTKTVNIYKNKKNDKKAEINLLTNTPLTTALTKILNVKNATTNGLDKKTILCNKLRNILVFIQAMLVEVYPVAKPIQPQLILDVVVQALSVSSSVSTDVTEAAAVKTEALRTVEALIACLGSNLIPFSALVFRFVMQTLRWSSENPSDDARKVRCTAYNSLNRWLSVLHVYKVSGDSRGRSWEDELTKHVVDDITPPKKVVQLTMSNQHTKNLSKKARRKLANTMLQQSSIANHMPGEKNKAAVSQEMNDDVANAALECAEMFLTVCGIFLKPTTHKMFQERLVRSCYTLEGNSAERSVRLLRALDAARKSAPHNVPPPTQYCLSLYSTLVTNRCDEIAKFCSQALLDIRLHLHCSPPSISYAIEPQQNQNTEDKGKKLSKKNREMLESLLGKDRIPQELDENEEIITIADEPANKKPRLDDDVTDKISVSSDSEQSIEISDDSENAQEIEIVESSIESNTQDQVTEEVSTLETNDLEQENTNINNDVIEADSTITENITEVEQIDAPEVETDTTITYEANASEVETNISNIYEAKTQIPVLNNSNDTVDGEKSPVSMEIAYDYPNTDKEVQVLDKIDGENLPSTNETDDIQITCGQVVQNSQEYSDKKVDELNEVPKENGISDTTEIYENGMENGNENEGSVEIKITTKEITVDDMLADFVDEVIEEGKTEA